MGPPQLLAAGAQTAENLSIFDPVSPPADSIRLLFILVLAITGGVFLLVEGVLVYSIVCFRQKPTTAPTEPPQVYGSLPIEIAWTAAPALIVFLLFLLLTRTEFEVRVDPSRPPPGSEPLYVTVVGHQWWWEYRYYDNYYEDFDQASPLFITANELHVPASDHVDRPVYLTLKSADVCHSYWVPRLAGKTDLIPGRTNQMWFQTRERGLFLGQCAEFCGTQHANMLLRVIVDSPADFHLWMANEKKKAADLPRVGAGRKVFLSNACVNCHRLKGTPARGTFGPDLTHLMSRKTIAAGMVDNTPAELRRWIVDPQITKPGCWMPAMNLSEDDVDVLVDYLRTLR